MWWVSLVSAGGCRAIGVFRGPVASMGRLMRRWDCFQVWVARGSEPSSFVAVRCNITGPFDESLTIKNTSANIQGLDLLRLLRGLIDLSTQLQATRRDCITRAIIGGTVGCPP